MTTLAWWHCFSGIAGDMALGSLVDAGADLDAVERELATLPIGGWSIEAEPVLRGGVAATRVRVAVRADQPARTHAHIVGLITETRLPARARDRALATFAALADVEGRLHRQSAEHIHFHEVGGIDAIVDVLGTCVALEVLGVDEIWVSPVAQGCGMIRSDHGLLPNPPPAVVALLAGAPTYGTDVAHELTTPTGAALVAALASGHGPMPAMTVAASGFGAGSRDLDGRPNALQVVIGTAAGTHPPAGQPVTLLEANVDDVTGETLAYTISALMAAGAHDAWVTPIVAKKGRPAHVVSALVDPAAAAGARAVLAAETGTLGVRRSELLRWPAPRRVDEVEVSGQRVRVKRSTGGLKAEHDDVARAAAFLHLPLRDVARRAEDAARSIDGS